MLFILLIAETLHKIQFISCICCTAQSIATLKFLCPEIDEKMVLLENCLQGKVRREWKTDRVNSCLRHSRDVVVFEPGQ